MKSLIDVAACVVMNPYSEVLVGARAGPPELRGLWEFPGGKLEPGETPKAAGLRELREELDFRSADFQHIFELDPVETDRFRLHVLLMLTRKVTMDPMIHPDHLHVCWMHPNDLMGLPMLPSNLPIAKRIKRMIS